MLLSSQIQVLRQWVVDAIAEGGLDPVPLERVVWTSQDHPDRIRPYVNIFYTGGVEIGLSPAQRTDPNTDEEVTRTEDETGISFAFVCIGNDASPTLAQLAPSYLRETKARLKNFTGDPIRTAELAIRGVSYVANVDVLQGRSQWESRAVLDVTFGHAIEVTAAPGIIETAEVTGTTTPATPSATQTIPG